MADSEFNGCLYTGKKTMLVLCIRRGDVTTITTPDGEILSIVMLDDDRNYENMRLGISAPHNYRILRHDLRNQLLKRLRDIPVFEVGSALHETQIIAADDYTAATHFYEQLYPTSCAIVVQVVEDVTQQPWFPRLETLWLQDNTLPLGIVAG